MTVYDQDSNDDFLDGICGFSAEDRRRPVRDGDETLGFVLFADIDYTDRRAVEERRNEWHVLFHHRGRRIGRFDA